jgi:Fe-S-cluster containining protein
MQDGHSAELIDTLIAKVSEMAERHIKEEVNQETGDRIPRIVGEIVTERVTASGPDTSDDGGRSYLYCEDCHDAPCCSEREIGVSIFDAGRMAKALGITRKKFIKKYLARYEGDTPALTPVAVYVFKHVNPCEFLNENARCSVYKARPQVCRLFPFDYNDDMEPF